MPIILKDRAYTHFYEINNPNVNLITEDPRPGHNVIYLGPQYQAYDSITLKPILGVNGNFNTTTSSYFAGSVYLHDGYSNGSRNSKVYMKLAGANPVGYGKVRYVTTYANAAADISTTAYMSNAWQMDSSFPNNNCLYKDLGDGTQHVIISSGMNNSQLFTQYSTTQHYNVRDDQELYEVQPTQENSQTSSPSQGAYIGFSNTDGTHSGLCFITGINTSYYTYANGLGIHQYNSTFRAETSYGPQGGNNHYMQSVGISRSDGLPMVLEMKETAYNPFFKIAKWSGTAYTVLFSGSNTANNGSQPFSTPNTTYAGTGSSENGGNTTDCYLRLASQWTKLNGATSKYMFMFYPWWDSNNRVHLYCVRWDTLTDTFTGAGMQGASDTYTGMYHRLSNNGGTYNTDMDTYVKTPLEAGTLPTTGATGQRRIHATWADVHGYSNRYGDSESYWDAESQTWQSQPAGTELQPVSIFTCTGLDDFGSGDAEYRRIICGFTDNSNGDTCYYYNCTGISTVPEMPIDWVWLNSGKTVIAAICKNNTYIYQCRKGDSLLDEGDASGTIYKPTNESFNADIHDASSTAMGWVHTATIPFQVIQMGTDKHDRVWYVTWEADNNYKGIATDGPYYQKQLWMMTDQTPFRVNLTGNATTDTITYSGSNIDKTLTIEALNFKGQRIAKNITLNITGSDAQFDNSSQTKNVTTSATATVDETITITGSGSFNITATFGA